ncbi:peptidase domain-containing ABC transporter [Paraliomyxa miuraensis]|uniref:peptidase domain-containing ABC transporter n=1 Tax=Paraliomyxa miuraensis TaxID=376150 RepID=UPI002251C554|nr:peptidase domain-containing ABC transporter [Paraliomyxa miuraensis]MCX4240916.1 peptidase domain-containing ABC transporter [Paraliomyxa miuraensis]
MSTTDLGTAPRWRLRGRRVPYVPQLQDGDCGAACLAMVLAYHGRRVDLGSIQEAIGIDRNGSDGGAIVSAASTFGLRGRGLSIEIEDFEHLPPATVLHWGFNHFVVFERATRRGVHLVDPAVGRRVAPWSRVRCSFTGVALSFRPEIEVAPPPRPASRFWPLLRRLVADPGLLSRIAVTSLGLRLFALSLPVLTGFVVDRVVPRSDRDMLLAVGGGLLLMVGFQAVSALLRGHLLLMLRSRLDLELSLGFLEHLTSLPFAFFQRRSSGDLMMRVNSHATIRELLTTSTLSALLDGSFVAAYLAIILVLSPSMAALVAGLGIAQGLAFVAGRGRYRELAAQELETRAIAQSHLVQLIGGIETLKAQGSERWAVQRWSNSFVDEINVSLSRGRLSVLIEAGTTAFQTLAPLSVLALGAVQVMDGVLSLGTMLALSALAASFLGPLRALLDSALQLQLLGGYVDRIDDVLRTEPERGARSGRAAPRLRGSIRLEGVGFGYGRDGAVVLDDIDLEIEAGSCVAIVGCSGSGKSTLAKLMLGLHEPSRGRITFDGHDLAELDLGSVRRQLGIVMQTPHLFGGSVRSNIALGSPRAGMPEVIAAARQACIHATIEAMPMGYETLVGEDGAALSGGERQRVALARALVGKPVILLLDEATSALDTEVERHIMDNLSQLRCTRIIIAHRMSTVASADTIVVLDRGRIVERGDHQTLMARGGRYCELVQHDHEW